MVALASIRTCVSPKGTRFTVGRIRPLSHSAKNSQLQKLHDGGCGRIRTYEATRAADLQSAGFNHFPTRPGQQAGARFMRTRGRGFPDDFRERRERYPSRAELHQNQYDASRKFGSRSIPISVGAESVHEGYCSKAGGDLSSLFHKTAGTRSPKRWAATRADPIVADAARDFGVQRTVARQRFKPPMPALTQTAA